MNTVVEASMTRCAWPWPNRIHVQTCPMRSVTRRHIPHSQSAFQKRCLLQRSCIIGSHLLPPEDSGTNGCSFGSRYDATKDSLWTGQDPISTAKKYDKELAKYSMLIGEYFITEVELQVDTTAPSALNFNVNKIRKKGTVVSCKKWRSSDRGGLSF